MFKAAHFTWAAIAVVVFLLGVAAPASAQTWQEYRPAGLGFKIDMPGVPKVSTEEDTFENKKMKTTKAEVENASGLFGVNYNEYAKGEIASQPVDKLFAIWRARTEKVLGVKVTRATRSTAKNVPVNELVIVSDGFHAVSRTYVVGDRVIQLIVTSVSSLDGNPVVKRFLDSFELL